MTFFRPSRSDLHLSNYWNALARKAPAEELARLAQLVEPSEIAAIEQARAAHQRYEPDPFFARRLEQKLMNTAISPLAGTIPQPPISPPSRNGTRDSGSVSYRGAGVPRSRPGWLHTPALGIALAVLLVLTSIGGVWWTTTRPDGRHSIMAPVETVPEATPATEACPATDLSGTPTFATPGTGSVTSSGADTPRLVIPLWQSIGGSKRLQVPTEIALALDGTVWVGDPITNSIQIFTPDGACLGTWGTPGSEEGQVDFDGTGGFGFGADGTLYIAESGANRVQQFAADGTFVRAWGTVGSGDGEFVSPFSVAVGPDGNVYVVDRARDDVQVFGPDGTYLFTFGEHGAEPGQFNQAGTIAIDDAGFVYAVDTGNHRIQKFSADGTFVAAWGEKGAGPGQFSLPVGIAVDDVGRMYVTDTGNSRVQVLAADGSFLMAWLLEDVTGYPFTAPLGIAVDDMGGVYVGIDSGMILKFGVTLPSLPEATPVA